MNRVLNNEQSRKLIDDQIQQHSGGVLESLAPFQPEDTFRKWHELFRAIEEFINVVTHADIEIHELEWLADQKISDGMIGGVHPTLIMVRSFLSSRLHTDLANRFVKLLVTVAEFRFKANLSGWSFAANAEHINTIGDVTGYLQSRRRHLLTLLYSIPEACKGSRILREEDVFLTLIGLVEHSLIAITGLYQKAVMAEMFDDFELTIQGNRFSGNHDYFDLEDFFLDPQTVSIVDACEKNISDVLSAKKEPYDSKKMFSVPEMRNSIELIIATHKSFGIEKTPYPKWRDLIFHLSYSNAFIDDFYFIMNVKDFSKVVTSYFGNSSDQALATLINSGMSLIENSDSFRPFILHGDSVFSNVGLIGRFMHDMKAVCLRRVKKYQVDSGFIFEKMVREKLIGSGFHITNVKRINRKEFDVVATKNSVIYNFQCKNNFIDLSLISHDRKKFIRYNKSLDRYYRGAISKEVARQALLTTHLGISEIRHYVVSRFPIFTKNKSVISFNKIGSI